MANWTPYTIKYNPLAAGSIDGTDTEPHDCAVIRALDANYAPPDVESRPDHTLFIGRLPHNFTEEKLREKFSRLGKVQSVRLVRDIVTGQSKGYGFVEFSRKSDANEAWRECQQMEIDGARLIVDKDAGHTLRGWVPRRLGGGWGGRKEAGQLRFGCVERPWRRPILLPQQPSSSASLVVGESPEGSARFLDRDKGRERFRPPVDADRDPQQTREMNRHRSRRDRHPESERRDGRKERRDHHYSRHDDSRHDERSHRHSRQEERDRGYDGRDGKERESDRQDEKDYPFVKHDRRNRDYNRQKEKDYY